MMTKNIKCYKLARTDGFDFYTGNTINYRNRGHFPHIVKVPEPNAKLGVCSSGVIHASVSPNDCFIGARIPCSAYLVRGKPVCGDKEKYGFYDLEVLGEIQDLDNLFGWKYSEVSNPIHPFELPKRKPTKKDIELLKNWASVEASVGASVEASVGASVWDSVWDSVEASVWDSVRASVRASVWDSVRDSVRASVRASVGAYIGSMFPNISKWKYIDHKEGEYPFQSCVELWKRGLVPSFDGKVWRLHSGKKAKVVWSGAGLEIVVTKG